MDPRPASARRVEDQERARLVEQHRPRLRGIAYRMLGALGDAEDIVQEAYLRWHEADRATIRSAEAWLVATATRLTIDRLRAMAAEINGCAFCIHMHTRDARARISRRRSWSSSRSRSA